MLLYRLNLTGQHHFLSHFAPYTEMLFLACLDLTFALVVSLNFFPLAVPNIHKHHKVQLHSTNECLEEFSTCFGLLSKDGGFLGQVLYGRGSLPGPVQERLPETITHYCRSLNDGLSCVDGALRGCSTLIEKDVTKKVRVFMRSFKQIDLCSKSDYREAFIDQDKCFFGLLTDPLQVTCVHQLVDKMNVAQQKAIASNGNVDLLFHEYCSAFQIFLECIADDLRKECGTRGRDIILHNFYQVMGFQGRKKACDVLLTSNEIPRDNKFVLPPLVT